MSGIVFVFVLGCFVSAFVALGLVLGVSALGDGIFGEFEGAARSDRAE